jgi:hypothetical protein
MTDRSRSAPCCLQSVSHDCSSSLTYHMTLVTPCTPADMDSVHDAQSDCHSQCYQHEVVIESDLANVVDAAVQSAS